MQGDYIYVIIHGEKRKIVDVLASDSYGKTMDALRKKVTSLYGIDTENMSDERLRLVVNEQIGHDFSLPKLRLLKASKLN